MFKIQNQRTGKFIKDAITGKVWLWENMADAEKVAATFARDSVLSATAWNSVRKSSFRVVAA